MPPSLSPSVSESLLLRARIFRRALLAFHRGRYDVAHKILCAHRSRDRNYFSVPDAARFFLRLSYRGGGLLIKYDEIPTALRERQFATNANGANHSVVPGTVRIARSIRLAFKIRFGRVLWRTFHGTADRWPCARCRAQMMVWMQGLHDAVNARLGKRPFRPDSFARYSSGALEGPYHRGCLGCRVARGFARVLARAPRPAVGGL